MADYAVPKNGVAYIFYGCLVSQADTKLFKSAPTLAAGDFKVSIDGGAFANLATLPTNTPGTYSVKFSLSAGEMTGDNILVVAADAAGAEWCDQAWNIQTSARGIADLAFPATSGRSMVVDAAGLVDANMVKAGPTGAGTAQTAGDIPALINTLDDYVDTEVAAIKAKTDNLPVDPADASDITASFSTVNTKLDTIDDFLDTEIAAIKAKTDNLPAAFPANFASLVIDASGNVKIQSGIKINQALTNFEFLMTDSTNHNPVTGQTVSVTRSINNGAFVAGTLSAVTEIGSGIYSVDFGAGDLNSTVTTLKATAAGCDTTFVTIITEP